MPGLSIDDRADFGEEIERVCGEINGRGVGELTIVNCQLSIVNGATGDHQQSIINSQQSIVNEAPLRPFTIHNSQFTIQSIQFHSPFSSLPSFAFGLETALRDLATGGRQHLWDTPFSRGEASLPTHGLIWMDTVDGLLRQIEAKIGAGFTVIKMKVGALPFAEELALLTEVRRAYPAGTIELRLDANGAFAPEEALRKAGTAGGVGCGLSGTANRRRPVATDGRALPAFTRPVGAGRRSDRRKRPQHTPPAA